MQHFERGNKRTIFKNRCQYDKADHGTDDAGEGHSLDPSADDRWGVSRKRWGRSGGRREVEREDVDKGVDNLFLVRRIHLRDGES